MVNANKGSMIYQIFQDVATKVMSYSGNGSAVYVLSAHGVVSNVTLRQGAPIHEAIIYEVRSSFILQSIHLKSVFARMQ